MLKFASSPVSSIMGHNDPTIFLSKCMNEVYHDVELEPPLQPLTGETFRHQTANTEPDARADIRVRGVWTAAHFLTQRCFFPTRQAIDLEVFSPCTRNLSLTRNMSTVGHGHKFGRSVSATSYLVTSPCKEGNFSRALKSGRDFSYF